MATAFDPEDAWVLNDRVALRSESFGALAYHFGTRRLSFLKSRQLVAVVRALGEYSSALEACHAIGLDDLERPAVVQALDVLASSEMIVPRGSATAPKPNLAEAL